ncbi:MAG: hypothetical protein K9M99_06260 [Candidatus Cloacimonetes bacterium]|nr:hypothetical protein [Candidatus Cloacimonadota bacterium]
MRRLLILFLVLLGILPLISWSFEHDIYTSCKYFQQKSADRGELFIEYYPSLQKEIYQSGNITLDGNLEISGRAEASVMDKDTVTDYNLDIYRFWLRSSTGQSEFRIGLQKLNFGPASYLRSLQWFDRLDPLDPRQQTEGVWSMLVRYYGLDNSNYWFWVIYDNAELKGQELVKTRDETLEMGGRMQLPILGGELGFSYHNRGVEDQQSEEREGKFFIEAQEKRLGFDGRWDIGIGLWLESSVSIYEGVEYLPLYAESYTIGGDYTFGLGNGVHILAEHQYLRSEESFWTTAIEAMNISLVAADYPLGIYDSLTGLASYDHKQKNMYYYLSYNRVYDYLSLYFNLSIITGDPVEDMEEAAAPGTQFQILLQLNY